MSVTYSNQRLVGVRPAEYMYSRLGVFHNTNIVEHTDTPVWYSYTSTFSTWEEYEGGISDYTNIQNKPQINSVTLSGDKDGSDIKVVSYDADSTSTSFTIGIDETGIYVKSGETKTYLQPVSP